MSSRANCQMFFFIQSSRDITFCFRVTWHKYFLRVRVVYIYILYWIVNKRVESRKNRCLCVFSETSAAGSGFWEKHALLSAHCAEHFVCEVASRVGNTSKATRDLQRSVVAEWGLSSTLLSSAVNLVFAATLAYGRKPRVMTERALLQEVPEMGAPCLLDC